MKICDRTSLPGPALLHPGTCIITSGDLQYYFNVPAFSPPVPALLPPDLHYFSRGGGEN